MPLRARLLLTAIVLAMAAVVHAVPYYAQDGRIVDIEYWAGDGANESVLIVDFRQSADDAYGFGFRWDAPAAPADTPTGFDALTVIAAAGDLEFDSTYYHTVPGWSVDRIRYLDDGGTLHQTSDWPPYLVDGLDPDDLSLDEGLGFINSPLGACDRLLMDRCFDGYVTATWPDDYVGFDYAGPPPRVPLFEGDDIIPEPATIALLGFGALALSRRRKRR